MKVKNRVCKLFAVLLSVMLLLAVVPMSAMAEGEAEFVSENLLRKDGALDTENTKPILFYADFWGTVYADTDRVTLATLNATIDGDKNTEAGGISANNTTSTQWFGMLYTLNQTTYVDNAVVYSGDSSHPDCYRVYASDSLNNLFIGDNMHGITCYGEADGVMVELHKDVKYLAVIYSSPETDLLVEGSTYGRIKEVELWSGDKATDFVSENLFLNSEKTTARAVKMSKSTGDVTDYSSNTAKMQEVLSGNRLYKHKDIDQMDGYKSGFEFTFAEPYYIGDILIDAGLYTYPETYEIYASNDINTLYLDKSRVATDVHCRWAGAKRINLAKKVKYIAIFQTASEKGGMRIRQLAAYTADTSGIDLPDVFVSENALKTKLEKAEPFVRYVSNGNIVYEDVIPADKLAAMTDDNTVNHKDLNATLGWDPARHIGAQFTLKEKVYIGKIKLYAGYETYPETYTIYASDKLETLYTSQSIITENARATEVSIVSADADREVKYIAFVCESYNGCPRFKEIEAWTAEPKGVFVSENLLQTALADSKGVDMFKSNGNVVDSTHFSADSIIKVTDGDTSAHCDLGGGGAPTWGDLPRYVGALFTLNDVYYVESLSVFAGLGGDYPESWRAYASDSLATLYTEANMVLKDTVCMGTEQSVKINKNIKYVAFFCTADTGNARPKEFQVWSGDPNSSTDEPTEPSLNDLKVLTIGNSFAENTSIYASEIAKANGKNLTFGYLKYPSCSIDMHYRAATENLAVFKFNVTLPDGTRIKVKNSESSFDYPNSEVSATLVEALQYAEWDVIVFQQDSANARYYNTFTNLGNLVNYVKGYNSHAKLMFHQVWRWGEWGVDQFDLIKANAERVAIENGLDIIPTGLAFEYARTALGSDTVVNDDDGNWQHANTYGQYIAGAVYTAKLFGIEVDGTKFESHPAINDKKYVTALSKAANDAVARYENHRGDIDGDGEILANDIAQIRGIIIGTGTATILADVTKDGTVNILDLVKAKKIFANVQ